jgi:hypothetical protein
MFQQYKKSKFVIDNCVSDVNMYKYVSYNVESLIVYVFCSHNNDCCSVTSDNLYLINSNNIDINNDGVFIQRHPNCEFIICDDILMSAS